MRSPRVLQAAAAVQGKADYEKPVVEAPTIHHIRITLTGRNVRVLEKVCADLINGAKKQKLRVKVGRCDFFEEICIFLGGLRSNTTFPSYENAKLTPGTTFVGAS